MKTFEIHKVEKATQEEIDDLMSTAMTGITYWCDDVRVRKHFEPKEETQYMSQALTRDGVLELHVRGDMNTEKYERWLVLDLDRLLTALSDSWFRFDDYDSLDADSIIQKAVFGEQIYG